MIADILYYLFWGWFWAGVAGSVLWNFGEWDFFFHRGVYSGEVLPAILWRIVYPVLIGPLGFVVGLLIALGRAEEIYYNYRK